MWPCKVCHCVILLLCIIIQLLHFYLLQKFSAGQGNWHSNIPLTREVKTATCQTVLTYFVHCAVWQVSALTSLFRGMHGVSVPMYLPCILLGLLLFTVTSAITLAQSANLQCKSLTILIFALIMTLNHRITPSAANYSSNPQGKSPCLPPARLLLSSFRKGKNWSLEHPVMSNVYFLIVLLEVAAIFENQSTPYSYSILMYNV